MAARTEAVELIAGPFRELAGELGLPEGQISYRPRAGGDLEELLAELTRRRAEDLGRAYTSYGPQLDEIEIRLADRPLRRFASQGQQRLALLALLFAEREALIDSGRGAPLMLLDDVMSELDPQHRELLVALLGRDGQSLITATEPGQVPAASALRLAVADGSIAAGPTLRAA